MHSMRRSLPLSQSTLSVSTSATRERLPFVSRRPANANERTTSSISLNGTQALVVHPPAGSP
ncbi:MAG: hypothetical protein ABR517_08770, partial [Thermoanaerobaculia bacterium]